MTRYSSLYSRLESVQRIFHRTISRIVIRRRRTSTTTAPAFPYYWILHVLFVLSFLPPSSSDTNRILETTHFKGMEARKEGLCSFCSTSIRVGDLLAPLIIDRNDDDKSDASKANQRGECGIHGGRSLCVYICPSLLIYNEKHACGLLVTLCLHMHMHAYMHAV